MKIIVIGSPGSGKSTAARRIKTALNYPILHLDRVYHIGGKEHITRDELICKIDEFVEKHNDWIIDGNYMGTMEKRIKLADTIILMDIPADICTKNAYKRAEESKKTDNHKEDMVKGFDETITSEFIDFIRNFKEESYPKIEKILVKYSDKVIFEIKNYNEIDACINNLLNN